MVQKRQTAHKVWISILHNGKYVKQMGEFEPNYVEYNGKEIGRVNVIGTITSKFSSEDKGYVALTLDDGSASIRIKAWKEDALAIEKYKAGDMVQVVGKPKEYNEEIYISPELVSLVPDPNIELLRKLELLKDHGKVSFVSYNVPASTLKQNIPTMNVLRDTKPAFEEEKVSFEEEPMLAQPRAPMKEEKTVIEPAESNRQKLLSLIEKLSGEDGAPVEALIKASGMNEEEVEVITKELLKEGEIYQNRPGRLSILG